MDNVYVSAPESQVNDFETNVVPTFENLLGALSSFNSQPKEDRLIGDQQKINQLIAQAKVAVKKSGVHVGEDGALTVKARKNSRLLKR